MSHHLVEAIDLHYSYPDGSHALNGINFRITHGESVAIVGANGAGKSTLLQHLNGYLWPTSGEVRIGDYPLTRKNLPDVRRSVGMVFQDSDDQLFMPTVLEDVAFGPLNLGLPEHEVLQQVESTLQQVGVLHLKNRPPHRLSSGEKRLVTIAAVLAMSPDVLVLDEPSAGLDPRSRRQIIQWLSQYRHTKILASHDLDLVLELCQRTIVLSEGRVLADGSTLDIFKDQSLLERSHLEQPFSLQGCPVCRKDSKADEHSDNSWGHV